jgi:hypothetical protein
MPRAHLTLRDALISQVEPLASDQERQENWWEFCPMCSSKLINRKCRFVCSNPECQFFMSCSEFDL